MGGARETHARDEKCLLNLSWKAWRGETTWKTKKWMGGTLKHRLHVLTVMTSEFVHLFLLKTFSIEIPILESCRNSFTCPNELYCIYAWLYYRLLFIPNYWVH